MSKKNKNENMKGKYNMGLIPVLSIFVSLFALYVSYYYSKAEYEYKVNPIIELQPILSLNEKVEQGEKKTRLIFPSFKLKIENKNNLDKLYYITCNNIVKKVNVIDKSAEDLGEELYKIMEDSVIENVKYRYQYLFLVSKSLDEDIDVNVVFAKSNIFKPDEDEIGSINFEIVDNITFYEWENADEDDEDYKGEKEILKQYRQILKWVEENDI